MGDARIAEERLETFQSIPSWVAAEVLLELTDEDLDNLALAEENEYWMVLRSIVSRISGEGLK
jgi:hypothetical protein